MNTEQYYVLDTIAMKEAMSLTEAQDYAKTMARKHLSAQYHVLKSVGHTTHDVGWEWHNESANKPERITNDTLNEQIKRKIVNQMVKDAEDNCPDMDGYRMLQEGEIIQDGDEFDFHGMKWVKVDRDIGDTHTGRYKYRRPINLEKTENNGEISRVRVKPLGYENPLDYIHVKYE